MSNAVSPKREKSIFFGRIGIAVLILSFIINNISLIMMEEGIGLYGGILHITSTTQIFHTFIFLISAVILTLNSFYPRKIQGKNSKEFASTIQDIEFNIIEYPLILLFVVTGVVLLISSSDLVSIFLSIELQSYGLYLISSLHRNSRHGVYAGLMYFLLGSLSSCFILLGAGLLYTNSGTTYLDGIYIITSISDIIGNDITSWYKPYYINYSLIFLTVGFLFKIGAAPFHFWSPDVYEFVPTTVVTFVSIIAKISILILFLELIYYTSGFFVNKFNWTIVIVFSSLLSLIIGSIAGLTEKRIIRLFAYSTITHVGFMLLALSINTIESTQAFIFYLMQYSISNINAFFLILAFGYFLLPSYTSNFVKPEGHKYTPIYHLNQLKGLLFRNPILTLSLAITVFSWMGIPPLVGFFGKQMVLSAALDNGYVFLTFVGILTSVISGVYYLNIVKEMIYELGPYGYENKIWLYKPWQEENNKLISEKSEESIKKIPESTVEVVTSDPINIVISVITLIIILFTMIPEHWLSMANILALLIFKA